MNQPTSIPNKNRAEGDVSSFTANLTIDLDAIGKNYDRLSALAKGAECAAVVKADAYGTGARRVASFLHKKGCKTFFVATINEGIALGTELPGVKLYILDGLLPGCSDLFIEHNLSPVLGSLEMLGEWSGACGSRNNAPAAALHIDTGMNRVGVGPEQFDKLVERSILENVELDLIMSHLACADEPDHVHNQMQLDKFSEMLKKLPTAAVSLANSAGIFLGEKYHFDLTRPGIALYGGRPARGPDTAMTPVVSLIARILQIRWVDKGEAIGYGADYLTTRKTRIATLPVGYADGYHRSLGSSNQRKGASTYIGDHEAPVLGRISMDLVTIDITDIPEQLAFTGAPVELLGAHVKIDDLAEIAGTIGYEILTSLGTRYQRSYTGGV